MAAHVRDIVFLCEASSCGKRATVEVYSTRNAPMGKFCPAHGARRVSELRKQERASQPEPTREEGL